MLKGRLWRDTAQIIIRSDSAIDASFKLSYGGILHPTRVLQRHSAHFFDGRVF